MSGRPGGAGYRNRGDDGSHPAAVASSVLASLLDCGRHLPVLTMMLGWAPPRAWAKLCGASRSFHRALDVAVLRELAAGLGNLDGVELHDILDAALGSALPQDGNGDEVACCEAVLVGILRGLHVNEARPATGIVPLMRAAEEGRYGLCQLLLQHRADANCLSVGGATALALALTATGSCEHSMHQLGQERCPSCSRRPKVAELLVRHTSMGLKEALGAAVRSALQDVAYLPVVRLLVQEKGMPIDTELLGPDSRVGTPLSAALERRVLPVEGPLVQRPRVVSELIALKADPSRQGPYVAWWGGDCTQSLLAFAAANECDAESIALLVASGAR
eukprot:gnl/TRDRNA2_/TRDRNA2_163620_c3_seq1.p1 gnl/TRDRNA2_/TRDRNA2_163620_c3~~gnl/TRDRNA2_/TRDRNA2_163620_c3_seq1.p1  ORF type:complete len:333 (+),score=57.51 gnl/TRDRNA2_/TRDRNA2_163620_c3_seq1:50-1048(+)